VNKKEFLEVVEILTDFYDRTPPKKQIEAWYGKLGHLDASVARDAADEVTSHMREFPTPAKFMEFADQVRGRQRSREVIEENRDARRAFDPGFRTPGLARECVIAINKIMDLGSSEAECVQKFNIMNDLAKRFPHLDWRPNLRDLMAKLETFNRPEAMGG